MWRCRSSPTDAQAGAGRSRGGRVRSSSSPITALLVPASVLRAATPGSPASQVNITLPGTFDWFALGMLLAVASAAPRTPGPRRRPPPAPVALARVGGPLVTVLVHLDTAGLAAPCSSG